MAAKFPAPFFSCLLSPLRTDLPLYLANRADGVGGAGVSGEFTDTLGHDGSVAPNELTGRSPLQIRTLIEMRNFGVPFNSELSDGASLNGISSKKFQSRWRGRFNSDGSWILRRDCCAPMQLSRK